MAKMPAPPPVKPQDLQPSRNVATTKRPGYKTGGPVKKGKKGC